MDFIFGGGMSGMIVSEYFKNHIILTKESPDVFGPRAVEKTPSVDLFLDRIEIPSINTMLMKVGYLSDWNIIKPDEEDRDNYLKKTRGPNWESFKDSGMNNGKNSMYVYDWNEIYSYLYNRRCCEGRVLLGTIKEVNLLNRCIKFGLNNSGLFLNIAYNSVVNTLPRPIFNKIIGVEDSSYSYCDIFVYVGESRYLRSLIRNYDFVYLVDDCPIYRIAKYDEDLCIESLFDIQPQNIIKDWSSFITRVLRGGKIIKEIESKDSGIPKIIHLGRYAQGKQNIRAHTLIEYMEETFGKER